MHQRRWVGGHLCPFSGQDSCLISDPLGPDRGSREAWDSSGRTPKRHAPPRGAPVALQGHGPPRSCCPPPPLGSAGLLWPSRSQRPLHSCCLTLWSSPYLTRPCKGRLEPVMGRAQ